jgi:hypothetical protein
MVVLTGEGNEKRACQIHAGYPGIQHSGNATIFAPASDASLMISQVFWTALARSSHAGSCCETATRTESAVPDMVFKMLVQKVMLSRTNAMSNRLVESISNDQPAEIACRSSRGV